MTPQETADRFNPAAEFPLITHGLPYPEACARHLTGTLGRARPFVVVSGSLMKSNPDVVARLETAFLNNGTGDAAAAAAVRSSGGIAGVHVGMRPHTYYSDVLEIAGEVRAAGADSIITIGGGSLVDGAKAVVLILANDVSTIKDMDALFRASNTPRHAESTRGGGGGAERDSSGITVRPPTMPVICATTTLSAGEYNPAGGATSDATHHKQLFWPPGGAGPRVLVVDPALARTAPARVWLSTGLRAVDHCVETICGSNPTPEGDEASLRGLRSLLPGLLRSRRDPDDLGARLRCQLGAADSMRASVLHGVHVGGSHGIGHQLGPMGVPHAETTCVCLPAVLKYNARANADRQAVVLDALWADPDVAAALAGRSLARGRADLGDALDALVRELGLPRTLADYGIGRDALGAVADSSLGDVCCRWNVVPLVRREQVLEILEMCLGDP